MEDEVYINKIDELSFFLKNIKNFIQQEVIDVCFLLFKKFSKDENFKTVHIKDLGVMLRLMELNPTNKEIEEMVNNLKSPGEEKLLLSLEEFLICVARRSRESDTLEELTACFRYLDKEANGKIPEPTLRYYLCNLSDKFENEEMDTFMKEASQFCEIINEIKYVNYPNFVLYLKDQYKPPEEDPKGKNKGKKK